MATIPLFNDGKQPRNGIRLRPVLAPTNMVPKAEAPQLTGAHVRAFEQPTVDPAPFARAAGAPAAAAGEAAMKIGETLGRLALAKAEVANRLEVAKAENTMSGQVADFERWKQANPDPQGWEEEWSRRSEGFGDLVFHDKLSPAARDAINERLIRFQGRGAIQVATDATKQLFAMEGAHIRAGIMTAAENGDLPAAERGIDQGLALGHWFEDDAARMKIQAKNQFQEKARERMAEDVAVAHSDPDQAKEDLGLSEDEILKKYDPQGTSGAGVGDAVRVKNSARLAMNRHKAEVLDDWNTQAFNGTWKTDDEIGAAVNAGLMDANDAERYKARRDEKVDDGREVERLGMVIHAVEKYDPAADAEGKDLLALKQLMNTLGRDAYGVAAGRLQARLSVANGEKHEHKGAGMARDALRAMASAGAFGEWKKEILVDDPKSPGEKKKQTVIDRDAKRKVIVDLARAMDAFDKWAQDPRNGDKSRADAVRAAMQMVPKNPVSKKGAAMFLNEAEGDDLEGRANDLLDNWPDRSGATIPDLENNPLFEGGQAQP